MHTIDKRNLENNFDQQAQKRNFLIKFGARSGFWGSHSTYSFLRVLQLTDPYFGSFVGPAWTPFCNFLYYPLTHHNTSKPVPKKPNHHPCADFKMCSALIHHQHIHNSFYFLPVQREKKSKKNFRFIKFSLKIFHK